MPPVSAVCRICLNAVAVFVVGWVVPVWLDTTSFGRARRVGRNSPWITNPVAMDWSGGGSDNGRPYQRLSPPSSTDPLANLGLGPFLIPHPVSVLEIKLDEGDLGQGAFGGIIQGFPIDAPVAAPAAASVARAPAASVRPRAREERPPVRPARAPSAVAEGGAFVELPVTGNPLLDTAEMLRTGSTMEGEVKRGELNEPGLYADARDIRNRRPVGWRRKKDERKSWNGYDRANVRMPDRHRMEIAFAINNIGPGTVVLDGKQDESDSRRATFVVEDPLLFLRVVADGRYRGLTLGAKGEHPALFADATGAPIRIAGGTNPPRRTENLVCGFPVATTYERSGAGRAVGDYKCAVMPGKSRADAKGLWQQEEALVRFPEDGPSQWRNVTSMGVVRVRQSVSLLMTLKALSGDPSQPKAKGFERAPAAPSRVRKGDALPSQNTGFAITAFAIVLRALAFQINAAALVFPVHMRAAINRCNDIRARPEIRDVFRAFTDSIRRSYLDRDGSIPEHERTERRGLISGSLPLSVLFCRHWELHGASRDGDDLTGRDPLEIPAAYIMGRLSMRSKKDMGATADVEAQKGSLFGLPPEAQEAASQPGGLFGALFEAKRAAEQLDDSMDTLVGSFVVERNIRTEQPYFVLDLRREQTKETPLGFPCADFGFIWDPTTLLWTFHRLLGLANDYLVASHYLSMGIDIRAREDVEEAGLRREAEAEGRHHVPVARMSDAEIEELDRPVRPLVLACMIDERIRVSMVPGSVRHEDEEWHVGDERASDSPLVDRIHNGRVSTRTFQTVTRLRREATENSPAALMLRAACENHSLRGSMSRGIAGSRRKAADQIALEVRDLVAARNAGTLATTLAQNGIMPLGGFEAELRAFVDGDAPPAPGSLRRPGPASEVGTARRSRGQPRSVLNFSAPEPDRVERVNPEDDYGGMEAEMLRPASVGSGARRSLPREGEAHWKGPGIGDVSSNKRQEVPGSFFSDAPRNYRAGQEDGRAAFDNPEKRRNKNLTPPTSPLPKRPARAPQRPEADPLMTRIQRLADESFADQQRARREQQGRQQLLHSPAPVDAAPPLGVLRVPSRPASVAALPTPPRSVQDVVLGGGAQAPGLGPASRSRSTVSNSPPHRPLTPARVPPSGSQGSPARPLPLARASPSGPRSPGPASAGGRPPSTGAIDRAAEEARRIAGEEARARVEAAEKRRAEEEKARHSREAAERKAEEVKRDVRNFIVIDSSSEDEDATVLGREALAERNRREERNRVKPEPGAAAAAAPARPTRTLRERKGFVLPEDVPRKEMSVYEQAQQLKTLETLRKRAEAAERKRRK